MIVSTGGASMRAKEFTAEFGIAGVLDFIETEHGLVKAAISLGGIAGELYLQGAQVTAWRLPGERPVLFTSPNAVFVAGQGDPRRHPDRLPVVRSSPARADGATARFRAHRAVASGWGRDRGCRGADPDPQPRQRRRWPTILAGAVPRDLQCDLRAGSVVAAHRAEPC